MSGTSSIHSIMNPSSVGLWTRLSSNCPHEQFFCKFWGKSMEDDRDAWRKSEQLAPLNDEDVKDDGECDFLPGCYAFNVDIPGFDRSIWVRAEYIRVFNACEKYFLDITGRQARGFLSQRPPSFAITGQPGIGKTLWQYYAARRFAAEKRVFIWVYGTKYFLYTEEGVYVTEKWEVINFIPAVPIWTLIDSESGNDILRQFTVSHTYFVVCFTTSPVLSHWKRMEKTTSNFWLVMNPWGREEIKNAAHLYGLSEEAVLQTYDYVGPIARYCLEYTPEQRITYESSLTNILQWITPAEIESRVTASELLTDTTKHSICLIRRLKANQFSAGFKVVPASPYIQAMLAHRLCHADRTDDIHLNRLICRFMEQPDIYNRIKQT